MMKCNDLINRAQSDLNDLGQVPPKIAQELIDALIAVTGERVFVCNEKEEE
jgi:hypothetical protein